MDVSSLEHKTVRPGNLTGYSYYHSNRQPAGAAAAVPRRSIGWRKWPLWIMALALVAALAIFGLPRLTKGGASSVPPQIAAKTTKTAPAAVAPHAAASVAAAPNPCAGNLLDQLVKVSISQRHMWACAGTTSAYDSPVVTGIDYLAADTTPTGTYHIYAKETDLTLKGSDTTGSWSDPVSYWMPFLDNQYGAYGFHDATWRAASDFGNISPDSANASHGCVELPLATAAWLYSWVSVGTTVTIES